jgi:hypothetical protein
MQAQGLVDLEHDRVRDDAESRAQSLDGNGPDLFGLRLGIAASPPSTACSRTWNG